MPLRERYIADRANFLKGLNPPLDPRITAARPDLAAEHLKGVVPAAQFAKGQLYYAGASIINMKGQPDDDAMTLSQLLPGEALMVYEVVDNWAFIQSQMDDYVGYVPSKALVKGDSTANATVIAPYALALSAPDIKRPNPMALPMLSRVTILDDSHGKFIETNHGWLRPTQLLKDGDTRQADHTQIAEQFIGTPYQWGGRSWQGIDCSGLVQSALLAAGISCPRDSDMQAETVGSPLEQGQPIEQADLRRGDIVFFPGHVGIMVDETRLLHANATHMSTVIEPLAQMMQRPAAGPNYSHDHTPITGIRRL